MEILRRRRARPGDGWRQALAEEFSVQLARYGVAGADPTYAAGCLFRAVGIACHALHGHARRWLINEKGMVEAAGRLPDAPAGFAEQAHAIFAAMGPAASQIAEAVTRAAALIAAVRAAVHPAASGTQVEALGAVGDPAMRRSR